MGKNVERGYKDPCSTAQDAHVLDIYVEGNRLVLGGNQCFSSKDADLPLNVHSSLKSWVFRASLPLMKGLCDQRKTEQPAGMDNLLPEAREELFKVLPARSFDKSNMLREHNVTGEKMDLKPIKAAKDPNFQPADN